MEDEEKRFKNEIMSKKAQLVDMMQDKWVLETEQKICEELRDEL